MAAAGIELNTVHSGANLAEWTEWSARTGALAVDLAEYDQIVDAIADLYAYADLRPYVTKSKIEDADAAADTEEAAVLDKSVGDIEDRWLVDFYVPCIEGSVGRDYVGAIAPKEDDYGLDIWVEVYGLSYADGTTWPSEL